MDSGLFVYIIVDHQSKFNESRIGPWLTESTDGTKEQYCLVESSDLTNMSDNSN